MQPDDIAQAVSLALAEDIGSGDITAGLIPKEAFSDAFILCREQAVVCGTAWFNEVFHQLNPNIAINWYARDGDRLGPDQIACELSGPSRALLTGERTALNFLQTLSATATTTRRFADAVEGTQTKILDTRKTIPGLRTAQKYAVTCGGGFNHRMGLYDGILIKENHILAAGSITRAVEMARLIAPETELEVEAENLDELKEAIAADADIVLLDNMSLAQLREAVGITAGRTRLEASGGITLENIRAIAETGVDYISIGALTKKIDAVDFSMRFTPMEE
jgi:nicotinate-nucleotide pyrophosphorylase (carboxylating)